MTVNDPPDDATTLHAFRRELEEIRRDVQILSHHKMPDPKELGIPVDIPRFRKGATILRRLAVQQIDKRVTAIEQRLAELEKDVAT